MRIEARPSTVFSSVAEKAAKFDWQNHRFRFGTRTVVERTVSGNDRTQTSDKTLSSHMRR